MLRSMLVHAVLVDQQDFASCWCVGLLQLTFKDAQSRRFIFYRSVDSPACVRVAHQLGWLCAS